MSSPKVAVVVLNWNGEEVIQDCLRSLSSVDYPDFEVILVDNGSSDSSVERGIEEFPSLAIIENRENLGFSEGNNVGLERATQIGAKYALLLNNDTVVSEDFLSLLVSAAQSDPGIAVVGPTICYHESPNLIWSAGGLIDWGRGQTSMIGLNEEDRGQFGNVPRPVDFVTGCALLVAMDVVDQVGGLDPRFFAYFEEVEWCVRMTRAGKKVLHVPKSKIWHKIELEARESSPLVHYYMVRNRLLFLNLAGAGVSTWVHTLLLDYLRTLASWSLRPRWRHKSEHRRVMIRAILDFLRGRFGPATLAPRP